MGRTTWSSNAICLLNICELPRCLTFPRIFAFHGSGKTSRLPQSTLAMLRTPSDQSKDKHRIANDVSAEKAPWFAEQPIDPFDTRVPHPPRSPADSSSQEINDCSTANDQRGTWYAGADQARDVFLLGHAHPQDYQIGPHRCRKANIVLRILEPVLQRNHIHAEFRLAPPCAIPNKGFFGSPQRHPAASEFAEYFGNEIGAIHVQTGYSNSLTVQKRHAGAIAKENVRVRQRNIKREICGHGIHRLRVDKP